jgi:ABC-type nitrate/sulfonate/bicarbonate transport system substrate-binding protein
LKRSDVTILQVGNEGTRMAALISGQVDGTMDQYPNTGELEAQGFRMLVDVTPIAGDYPNTSYVTSRAYLKKHPDVLKRFLSGITESIRAYKNDPEGAMKLTAEFLNLKEGPILKKAYEFYTRDVFPDLPEYSLQGMQLVLDELKEKVPAAGSAKPEQFVDGSIIEQLKKDGYPAKVN